MHPIGVHSLEMSAPPDLLSSALFGKTRRGILALLLGEPDTSFFLREIVRRIGAGQGAAQRELRRLAEAEIILRRPVGRTVMYRANPESPVYEDLRGLVAKTAGVTELLKQALAELRDRIGVAFIYGSFAKTARTRAASDIDVMVVGDVSFGEIVDHVGPLQEKIGREVNPTVYTQHEFARRARTGHHFVGDVLKHPKLFVIGGLRELERLAEGRLGDASPTHTRRNSSAARRRGSRSSR